MKATIELEVADAKVIEAALAPDIAAERFSVELKPAGKVLTLVINAGSVGELTAGINSCLRLVRAAAAAQEVK